MFRLDKKSLELLGVAVCLYFGVNLLTGFNRPIIEPIMTPIYDAGVALPVGITLLILAAIGLGDIARGIYKEVKK